MLDHAEARGGENFPLIGDFSLYIDNATFRRSQVRHDRDIASNYYLGFS